MHFSSTSQYSCITIDGLKVKMEYLTAVDFFDLSQELFCVVDTDGCFKKVNTAFASSVGYPQNHLEEKSVLAFVDSLEIANASAFYEALLSGTRVVTNFHCSNGTSKWFSWSGTKDPRTQYLFVLLRDVSKEKLLEKQLNEALLLKERVLDSSIDLICSIDSQGQFSLVSKSCYKLLGYSSDEISGKSCHEFVHPEDQELTSQMAAALLNGAEMTNFENRYIHKNGSVVPLVWSGRWSEEDNMFYCSARNATEKIRQEEQFKFNERRFKGLVQTGADLISILDDDYCLQYVSPTVTTILGFEAEDLLGKRVLDFIDDDYRQQFTTAIKMVHQQFRVELPLLRIQDARGKHRILQTTATNLFNDESIKGIVLNSRDVTKQLAIEEQKTKAIHRLNNLIEKYNQGYFNLDKDWIVRGVNPEALRLLETTADSVINRSLTELFPNETAFYKHYEAALRENKSVAFDEKMSSKNRWFHITAYPYEDNLTVFFKDITGERLQSLLVELEKDVLDLSLSSDANLRDIVNKYLEGLADIYQMKCMVSLYDKRTTQLKPLSYPALPAGFVDLVMDGFPVGSDLSGAGDNLLIPDIKQHPYFRSHKETLQQLSLMSCRVVPMIGASGVLFGTLSVYHKDQSQPDKNEQSLVTRVGVFLQLIIESKLTKDKLLVSNERYKHITKATNDATYDYNIESGIVFWGEGESKLFGYQNHKSTIADWGSRIDPEEKVSIDQSLGQALADPDVSYWRGEYRYQRADGFYAYVIDDGYISRDKHGRPVRMVGALKDVSALKEKENKILKQNKRLQQIATINSHHIRKPLANILGIIAALKYSEEESREELITMLDMSGLELDKIVRKIAKKTLV